MFTRLLLAAALVSATACSDPAWDDWQPVTRAENVVVTSFEPARYLAARLVGDLYPVTCPLPETADPAGWHPKREHIVEFQKARLIVTAGADFEHWVGTASLPSSRVVKLADGLTDDLIETESVTHSHGAGGAHTHAGIDGHTWLDPVGLREQADYLLEALVRTWPEHEAIFEANAATLRADLKALHRDYEAIAEDMRGAWVLCSHSAYNYLGRRYGWQLTNLDIDPAAPLADADRAAVAARVHPHRPTLLLWEEEPLPATITALDALGVRSVVVAPGERPSPDSNLLDTFRANAARLAEALER